MEILMMLIALLVLVLALILYAVRSDAKSEPDGNTSYIQYPTCFGDYPENKPSVLFERECFDCGFKEQCKERTPK